MPPLLMAKRHVGAELEEQDQPPRVCLQPSPELRGGAVLAPGDFKGPRGRAWAAVALSVVATARSQCKEGDMVNPFVKAISPWLIGPAASNPSPAGAVIGSKGGGDLPH